MFERLGKYFLCEESSGVDGVATHRAYTVSGALVRAVSVRRAQPGFADRPEVSALLAEEGRITALLDHPNVARVLDLDQANGGWVVVLERSMGADLATVLRKARMRGISVDPHTAVYLAIQVLQALAHAHERTDLEGGAIGLVHRDVSPSNIFVGFGGEVKLGGFGFARTRARPNLTPVGFPRPRYGYVSPEQAQGTELDHRSDLFAVGLVLYELLAGLPAYEARSELEALTKAQRGAVRSMMEVAPALGPDLRSVVERALALDRRQRHPSAAAFRDELARHLFLRDPTFAAGRVTAFMAQVLGDMLAEERLKEREERAELEPRTAVRAPGPEAMAAPAPAPMMAPPPAAPAPAPAPQPAANFPRAWATAPTDAEVSMSELVPPASRPVRIEEPQRAAPRPAPAPAPPPVAASTPGMSFQPAPAMVVPPSASIPISLPEPKPLPIGKIALALVLLGVIGLGAYSFSSESNMRKVQRKLRSAVVGRQPGGTLTIESVPPEARVFLDGDDSGKRTPLTVENLESGVVHDLRLELDGEKPVTSTVAIRPGAKSTTTLIFQDAVVTLSLKSEPPGAEVWMDKRSVALTPASMTLRVGQEISIRLSKAGYVDFVQQLKPERGKPVDIDAKLEMTPEMAKQKELEDAAIKEAEEEEKRAAAAEKKKRR